MTWVCLGILLAAGLGLMVVSWNGALEGSPSYMLMVFLWLCISSSGIYLFLLGVKKAHRLWVHDERRKRVAESEKQTPLSHTKTTSKEKQELDFAATARKLVRHIPEDVPLEESGREILENLAKELEIMSGIFYLKKKTVFEAVATYALSSPGEPYSFKEGEGLTGQAARNQQIMVLTTLPEAYLEVFSGLGKSEPSYLAITPLVHKNKTVAVLECAGYRYDPHDLESMFRIFSRDMMEKLSPHMK